MSDRVAELQDCLYSQDRNAGPSTLEDWWLENTINADELRALIIGVWSGAEWPAIYLDEDTWLLLFEETGFVSDGAPQPTEPMRVYRGARIEAGPRGFSWTQSVDVARWFARREAGFLQRGPAGVWEAIIPTGYILAIIDHERVGVTGYDSGGPPESEVIVDPSLFDLDAAFLAEYGQSSPRLLELYEGDSATGHARMVPPPVPPSH